MILAKEQTKPLTLEVMEALCCRMVFARIDMEYLNNLRKGYEGEVKFVQMLTVLGDEVLVFPDLLPQPRRGNVFQLDVVVLIGRVFYLYEVKNFSGEYRYGEGIWENKYGTKVVNPLIRMEENKNKFIKLLHELGYEDEFQVEAHTVLVDPNFTLYYAPDDQPLILPSQINRHIETLQKKASPLTCFHRQVMETLLANQGRAKVFWEDVPFYRLEELHKELYCHNCKSSRLNFRRYKYCCQNCNHTDSIQSVIESNIFDYLRLFSSEELEVRAIHEWIGERFSERTVRRAVDRVKEARKMKR